MTSVNTTEATTPEANTAEQPAGDVEAQVHAVADRSRTAARRLARANRAWKDRALRRIAENVIAGQDAVLAANARDVAAGRENGTSAAMLDRLSLTPERITALARALENLAGLPDPVGSVARGQTLPNGLRLRQVHVPMGVVAAIYEARPNVTLDIAGLALKSGNAVILRGGSAAAQTNAVLVEIIRDSLQDAGLPADAVQTVDAFGREGAGNADIHPGKPGPRQLRHTLHQYRLGGMCPLPYRAACQFQHGRGQDVQRRQCNGEGQGQGEQPPVIGPGDAHLLGGHAEVLGGGGLRRAGQGLGADPVVPGEAGAGVQCGRCGHHGAAHEEERRPVRASETLRKSSLPSAARPSSAPTAMNRAVSRKPQKSNISAAKASTAPVAIPTTVGFISPAS